MNTADLTALLDRLRAEPRESEWLEFKANRYEPQAIGEYLSALANSACLLGKLRGYLVFGIEDGTHAVVGTSFYPQASAEQGNQLLPLWLALGLKPKLGFEVHSCQYHGQRVVVFEVHPAFDRPVEFYGKPFVRNGSSKTALAGNRTRSAPSGRAVWTGARRCANRPRWRIWTRWPLPKRAASLRKRTRPSPTDWQSWPSGMTPRF